MGEAGSWGEHSNIVGLGEAELVGQGVKRMERRAKSSREHRQLRKRMGSFSV